MPTYEDIEEATMAALRQTGGHTDSISNLKLAVADILAKSDRIEPGAETQEIADNQTTDIVERIFFDLVAHNYFITDREEGAPIHPDFKLSPLGLCLLSGAKDYRFYDFVEYLDIIEDHLGRNLDGTTGQYVNEAYECFGIGKHIATTSLVVMAAESLFRNLLEAIASNPTYNSHIRKVMAREGLQNQLECFSTIVRSAADVIPDDLAEKSELHFAVLRQIMGKLRDASGKLKGEFPHQRLTFSYLQAFIPIAHTLGQLHDRLSPNVEEAETKH